MQVTCVTLNPIRPPRLMESLELSVKKELTVLKDLLLPSNVRPDLFPTPQEGKIAGFAMNALKGTIVGQAA